VPLFVTVLGKNADDNMRNISAFLAQDKVERLRQLDYMEITPANLASSSFKSGQFGPTVAYQTGSGAKTFQVRYGVTTFPIGADLPSGSVTEQYREVSVHVYWEGAPLPVKHVYQVVRVYRQYAGPSVSLGITPTPDADGAIFDPTQVVLTATVPYEWISTTSKVHFAITLDDLPIASQDVLKTGTAQYQWTWTGAATATLGLYKFTAVAYASDALSAGEETGLYVSLASNTPDPPTGLTATAGVKQVSLAWDLCPNALFDHFEIWRSTTKGQPGTMIATTTDVTYVNTGLTAGTTYYYSLKVVTNKAGTLYTSLACSQVSAMAKYELADDKAAPSVSVLTATSGKNTQTINLTWTASVDNIPDLPYQSGLSYYAIYHSTDGTTWGAAICFPAADADRSWPDTNLGWAKKWYYKIQAYDLAGNFSTSAVKNATTVTEPFYTLTVTNDGDKEARLWVRNMSTLLYYNAAGAASTSPPAVGDKVKTGRDGTIEFKLLREGSYNVYANYVKDGGYVSTPFFSVTPSGPGPYVCTITNK